MDKEFNLDTMTDEYVDVLRELGNIGAGNAMTALAQLLNCKVDMQVPQVRLLEFKDVGSLIGGEEQIMAGIYLAGLGGVIWRIFFFFWQGKGKKTGG